MIDILKKRNKIGDTVTLHTSEASLTGVIEAFEETCVILSTEEGNEFIANDTIKRISVPKTERTGNNEKVIETIIDPEVVNSSLQENLTTKKSQQENLPVTFYKAGDKIPEDVLEKRIDNKNKAKPSRTSLKVITYKSFSDLLPIYRPEIEVENKKIVSANGTIVRYFEDRNYGFITDMFGNLVWFGFNKIIDESLGQSLRGTVTSANIPVLFTWTKNYKGDSAAYIHKPKTVEQIAELANQFFEKEGKPDTALGLVDQILFSFPGNYTAIKLKEEINEKRLTHSINKPFHMSYESNYQRAKKLHNLEKNYREALKYYLLALENNEKKESCIKDVADLYVVMGETENALEFIKKYEYELPDSVTTYNYLENFYGTIKDFDKVLEYTDLLIDDKTIMNDKRKNSMYLSKKDLL